MEIQSRTIRLEPKETNMFDTPPPAQVIQAPKDVQERYIKEQERLRKRAEEERRRQIDAENRRKLAQTQQLK